MRASIMFASQLVGSQVALGSTLFTVLISYLYITANLSLLTCLVTLVTFVVLLRYDVFEYLYVVIRTVPRDLL